MSDKKCYWKLTKTDQATDKVTYKSDCGLVQAFVNGVSYRLLECPKCGRRVRKLNQIKLSSNPKEN